MDWRSQTAFRFSTNRFHKLNLCTLLRRETFGDCLLTQSPTKKPQLPVSGICRHSHTSPRPTNRSLGGFKTKNPLPI